MDQYIKVSISNVNSVFHPSGVPVCLTKVKAVTLCDAIWQVTLRGSEMGYH